MNQLYQFDYQSVRHCSKTGRHDSVSKYANKNPRDFFAECFANACCGKVNVYGESVVEYLKRRGYLDEK